MILARTFNLLLGLLLVLVFMLGLLHLISSASPAHASAVTRGLPAAVVEDSCAAGVRRCVWDERHRGNGIGRSFILTDGDVRYVSHKRAHRLIARWCARTEVDCRY